MTGIEFCFWHFQQICLYLRINPNTMKQAEYQKPLAEVIELRFEGALLQASEYGAAGAAGADLGNSGTYDL